MTSTRVRRRPVLIDIGYKLVKSDLLVPETAEPADVAVTLREKGWQPYRIRFDSAANVWIASNLDGPSLR